MLALSLHRQPATAWTTIAAVLLLVALDAIIGRGCYLSLIRGCAALPAGEADFLTETTYLPNPPYPSDLLFVRQILELLQTMLKAKPLTAMLVGLAFTPPCGGSRGALPAGAPSIRRVAALA